MGCSRCYMNQKHLKGEMIVNTEKAWKGQNT